MVRIGNAPYLECSSRGDKRFSAFCAYVLGNSIEAHYQGAKVFPDGKTNLHWRKAKGRKCVNQEEVAALYKELWRFYLDTNPGLYQVLADASGLSDMFGEEGHICQAITLWELRNEWLAKRGMEV